VAVGGAAPDFNGPEPGRRIDAGAFETPFVGQYKETPLSQ